MKRILDNVENPFALLMRKDPETSRPLCSPNDDVDIAVRQLRKVLSDADHNSFMLNVEAFVETIADVRAKLDELEKMAKESF